MTYSKNLIKIFYTSVVVCTLSFFLAFYFSISLDTRIFSISDRYLAPMNSKIFSIYPNLDSVIIHFERPATESGFFVFQLQENKQKNIYYKAKYSLRDIYNLPTYPFGFEPITNSQNKTYIVNIESSELIIKKKGVAYELVYPFDKGKILRGEYIVQFVKGKMLQYWNGLFSSGNIIFFVFPSIFYFILSISHLIFKQKLKKVKLFCQTSELFAPSFLLLSLYIGYDILFLPKINDLTVMVICAIWILLTIAYRFSSKKSFLGALFFLSLCPLLLISGMQSVAEKAAIWAYMFMIIGTIHMLVEIKTEEHPNRFKFVEKIHILLQHIVDIDSRLMIWYKKTIFKKQEQIQVKMTLKDYIFYALRKLKEYVLLTLYIVICTIIVLTLVTIYTKVMSIRDRKLKNPSVQIIEPTLVYPATKVVVLGNSFGSKIDDRYRLMKDGVEIRPDYWEDHKIIFTIPLGWKTGFMNVWIERPVQWNGETVIEKTKPSQIKLLPITSWNAPDDDLYFEQIKTWRKETREINGYQ